MTSARNPTYSSERPPESTRLTLRFRRDGSVIIEEEVSSPGTSASNTLGGTFLHRLNKTFYQTGTHEEIAAGVGADLRDAVLRDGSLADFMAKARTRDLFTGNNR